MNWLGVTQLTSKTSPPYIFHRKERIDSLSPMNLLVAICFETLMRKPQYFFILNSCHSQGIATQFPNKTLTGHLQSCGCDRGWSDVTATPDTLCGWHGWKIDGVPVIFTNIYC